MSAIPKSTLGVSAFTRANDSFARSESLATSDFWERNAASEPSWQSAIDELLRIRNLNDDWDGEGTEAPPPALVDGAITLAQHLQAEGVPAAERVLAGVNGTIYFEWHTLLGYQEIEVTSPRDAELRWVGNNAEITEFFQLSRRS